MTLLAHTFFIVSLLAAAWYQFVHVGMRQLSVSTLLLTLLILIHGIPMLVYQHWTGPDTQIFEAVLGAVNRDETLARSLLALGAMFLCVMLGISCANIVLGGWRRRGRMALRQEANGLAIQRDVYGYGTYARLGIGAIGLWMLLMMLINGVPGKVLDYFRTEGLEVDKILMRREFGGIDNYAYNVTLYSIAPFLCAVALMMAVRKSALFADKLLAAFMLGVVMLGKLGTLSKAPPAIFMLQLLLLWFLATGRRLNLRNALLVVFAVVCLFGLMAHAVVPELDLGATLTFLYYRVFDITNGALVEYMAAYPAQIPHGWGSSFFAMFGSAAPKIPSYFAVGALAHDDALYDSASNSVFIADAWAEYSWIGVIFTSTLAGFWTRAIDLYAFRRGRTDEAVCIVTACAFGVFTMLSTSFPTALITGGLATVPLVSTFFIRRRRAVGKSVMQIENTP